MSITHTAMLPPLLAKLLPVQFCINLTPPGWSSLSQGHLGSAQVREHWYPRWSQSLIPLYILTRLQHYHLRLCFKDMATEIWVLQEESYWSGDAITWVPSYKKPWGWLTLITWACVRGGTHPKLTASLSSSFDAYICYSSCSATIWLAHIISLWVNKFSCVPLHSYPFLCSFPIGKNFPEEVYSSFLLCWAAAGDRLPNRIRESFRWIQPSCIGSVCWVVIPPS